MYVNDLLIRCKELQEQGAGDRTVQDQDGNDITAVAINANTHVVKLLTIAVPDNSEPVDDGLPLLSSEEEADIPEAGGEEDASE